MSAPAEQPPWPLDRSPRSVEALRRVMMEFARQGMPVIIAKRKAGEKLVAMSLKQFETIVGLYLEMSESIRRSRGSKEHGEQ